MKDSFDFNSLMKNPMFMTGMGLLSNRRNPMAGAMSGLLTAEDLSRAEEERKMRLKEYELRMAEYEAAKKAEEELAQKKAISQAMLQSMTAQGGVDKFQSPEIQGLLRPFAAAQADPAMLEQGGLLAPQREPQAMPKEAQLYELARTQGFKGSLMDFMQAMQSQGGSSPYYQFLPTDKGYMVGNARTGGIESAVGFDGGPIVRPADSPDLQRVLAEEKARGRVLGTKGGEAAAGLPKVFARTDETLRLVQELKDHPGKSQAVGMSSIVPLIPGTAPYDFEVRRKQIAEGQNFLAAIQEMRGLGVLTEQEGTKATAAIARMERAQSEPEFDAALDELMATLQRGKAVAEAAAGGQPATIVPNAPRGVLRYNPATGEFEE